MGPGAPGAVNSHASPTLCASADFRANRERMLALEKGGEPPALPPAMVGHLASKPRSRYLWPRAMRNGLMLQGGFNTGNSTKTGNEFYNLASAMGADNML